MKIVTVVGARPQFIKSAPVSKALREFGHTEILVHTGQHYDADMSDVFFKELDIPRPDYNLGINSASHGAMTGRMLEKIEEILIKGKPDWVLVYGDTNSTLAGALSAAKLHIPVAHVEAGLRSFNREMPEEINRVLTDHCADILFCPTETAVNNLRNEGFTNILTNPFPLSPNPYSLPLVTNVGDTMYDAVLQFSEIARRQSTILDDLGVKSKEYLLATVHRPYNTDIPENLESILSAFLEINEPIIFPVHPRTKQCLINSNSKLKTRNLKLIPPVGYLDMLVLEQNARAVLTDSGGVQKEAYFHGVPCITLREETEWVELVEHGFNKVAGNITENILKGFRDMMAIEHDFSLQLYGDGNADKKIVSILVNLKLTL